MVDALVEDVGINEGLAGEMMGGQNGIAELIWFGNTAYRGAWFAEMGPSAFRRSGSLGYCCKWLLKRYRLSVST